MLPWYKLDEALFEEEKDALIINRGFSLNEEKLKDKKKVEFQGKVDVNGEVFTLRLEYPYGYPEFSPECFVEEIQFARHQSPDSGKMCLYEEWKDNSDLNGVDVLDLAIEWIKRTQVGQFHPDEEIDGPEPKQYSFIAPSIGTVITPEEVYLNWQGKEGIFKVNLRNLSDPQKELYLNGMLTTIHSSDESYDNDSRLNSLFQDGELVGKCFQVLTAPPYFKNQHEIISWLGEQGHKDIMKKCRSVSKHIDDPRYSIGPLLGIKYIDEVGKRGNLESRFLVIALKDVLTQKRKRPFQTQFGVFNSNEISPTKLFKRVPNLQPLSNKHVVVLGLGTIGAPVALEFAKAGVGKLTLVDRDVLNVGNVIRHICNLHQVGLPKVHAVRQVVNSHNPYVEVIPQVENWGMETSDERVATTLRDADLIVCAVAHTPTEVYMNKMAYHFNIPVIYSYAGFGAWSGRVFRIEPGLTGCYDCNRWNIYENEDLQFTEPKDLEELYDNGCATPAFPGSGIDTGILANLTSRLSIQTLLTEHPNSYEPSINDHIVWTSQGNNGQLKMVQKIIETHPKCERCKNGIPAILK
jgi:molybdopterin/thiamine biosynthesis adenylyltransferase